MSLFGQANNSATPSGSLFGGQSTGSLFGGANTGAKASGLFQPQKSQFATPSSGQPATEQKTLFGGASIPGGAGLFGGQSQATATGGGLFGGQSATPAQGGGLFGGQSTTPAQGGGLFGGQSTTPAQGGGLFGGQQPQTGGLFGQNNTNQNQTTSLFGGQQPQQQQTSILGGQQQQQQQLTSFGPFGGPQQPGGFSGGQQGVNQNGASFGEPPTQQSAIAHQYYYIKGAWSPEMMQKLIESQGRQLIQNNSLQTSISMQNIWRNRSLGDHQYSQDLAIKAKQIDDKFSNQQSDLLKFKTSVEKISQKIVKLDLEINSAVSHLQSLNSSQQSVSFQIQALNIDVYRLVQFREQLGQAIHWYQNSGQEFYNKIQVPSTFFEQLQKHHEKVIGMFENKISEAENIVEALIDSKEKTQQKDFKEMKTQIFEVCKLIYDEQRIAGAQLKEIELKVQQLRQNFTRTMIKQKGYWGSEEELNQLFNYESQQNTRIHAEVQKKIAELKTRNISSQLENQLKNMNIGGSKKEEKTTIKEKLQKGLYTSNTQSGYGLWTENPLSQRNNFIGKRPDPFTDEQPYSQYFVKKLQPEQPQVLPSSYLKRAKVARSPLEQIYLNTQSQNLGLQASQGLQKLRPSASQFQSYRHRNPIY